MYRPTLMRRTPSDGNALRTIIVSAVGLLPVGVVSGMMLMQILGVWTY